MAEMTPFEIWLKIVVQTGVEQALDRVLPDAQEIPAHLHQAMRYACEGGKRVRAALVMASGAISQKVEDETLLQKNLLQAALAVELIHAYSLVHDDMPCMDNDALRRGKPTVHVKYGESTALLVGDALQTLAFEELTQMSLAPALVIQSVRVLAHAAGSLGMVGGQALDLSFVDKVLTVEQLQQMHQLKTGALIEASVLLGGVISGASYEERLALGDYARAMGLAFQVVDDILDVTQNTQDLGKTAGKDEQENKPTYVSIMGLDAAQSFAETLYKAAIESIRPFGDRGTRLHNLANFMVRRKY